MKIKMLDRVWSALDRMKQENNAIQDTHGNVSGRDEEGNVWIKPSGVPYNQIRAENIAGITPLKNGSTIQFHGDMKPSVDTVHHIEIYRNFPHIKAICHTHSPHVVAFAIRRQDIKCTTTEQADYFGGPIRCFPYSDLNNWGADLDSLEGEKAVILANHGSLTFAEDPVEAVKLAIMLENIARKNILAGMLDVPESWRYPLPPDEVQAWHERYQNVYGQK